MTKTLADCWRYRTDMHGALESKLFALHEAVPEGEGWCLTPGEAGFPELDKVEPIKPRRGRPPKVKLTPRRVPALESVLHLPPVTDE